MRASLNQAFSDAISRSQSATICMPTPVQTPLTAPITGFVTPFARGETRVSRVCSEAPPSALRSKAPARSFTSIPAQKANSPAPLMIAMRASSSASKRSHVSGRSTLMLRRVSALRRSGRLIVIHAMRSRSSYSMSCSLIVPPPATR